MRRGKRVWGEREIDWREGLGRGKDRERWSGRMSEKVRERWGERVREKGRGERGRTQN